MKVELNGKTVELDGVETVGQLLRSRDLKPQLVAVELNGEILPRDRYDEQYLGEGDRLEIVHFVGGG
jgi:thiamine biosynthesis protein ThiS